ncbi:hypothetical protein [Flavobacterium aurantiibacter]|uniref:Uncharacterized protein n=1 Tax=Flavobacterium aurantiibacter TaxID=2023067 RepID=A0A255ZAK7_9FLAO|nr:hypothetical protein [Flavobacterium aurantiibacter]OYQ38489.1 hypothetical protein CHX27_15140 [Flavobacterium aurantiibacter]
MAAKSLAKCGACKSKKRPHKPPLRFYFHCHHGRAERNQKMLIYEKLVSKTCINAVYVIVFQFFNLGNIAILRLLKFAASSRLFFWKTTCGKRLLRPGWQQKALPSAARAKAKNAERLAEATAVLPFAVLRWQAWSEQPEQPPIKKALAKKQVPFQN